jgi:uncharacterized protein YutE (UPF0331/DUF86 family)
MVISSLNTSLIADRLKLIRDSLFEMKKMAEMSFHDFLADKRNPASTESFLRRSLEAVFDIGRHILAKSKGKKIIEYKEIALLLGREKVIPLELSQRLIPIAGYRNRLVHFYHEINDKELYEIIKKDLVDIEDFVKAIERFLRAYRKNTPKV